jgi:hypothetical protein
MGLGLDFSLLIRTNSFVHPRFEDELKKLLKNNVISSQNALFRKKLSYL